MTRGRAALVLTLLLIAASAWPASRYLPGLRFRVLATPHFRIYYHQGEAALARRLASIAEIEREELARRLGLRAPSMTHVVLADQDDSANGSAIPLPYNTITINAAWPRAEENIGNTSDWLRLVFVHEFTHILQLDQSRGWAAALRPVFGRAPWLFPNLFLPEWQIEGLATFEESAATGEGRLAGGDSRTVVTEQVRRRGTMPLDRVSGGLASWPSGNGPYLYGALFHEYLARRGGEASLGALAQRTSGRLPYLGSRAFESIYGRRLGELWKSFQASVAAGERQDSTTSATRLTHDGFLVTGPRFTATPGQVLYSSRNADEFPALVLVDAAGRRRRLATRASGDTTSVVGDVAVFDQLELAENVALRSDLYAVRVSDGHVRRLTWGARLEQPSLSSDRRRLAAIQTANGARRLVVFDLTEDREGLPLMPGAPSRTAAGTAQFGNPRWSPDGQRLAVERRALDGPSEIVVFDSTLGDARVVASATVGRIVTPAWTPDGARLFVSFDRGGRAPQVFGIAIESPGRMVQVTSLPGGASYPEVSPDGRTLLVTSNVGDGYDVFAIDLGLDLPAGRETVAPSADAVRRLPTPAPAATPPPEVREQAYSPLDTLWPRAWTPLVDTTNDVVRVGAAAGGTDVLGRHTWAASVLWRTVATKQDLHVPDRARPDWNAIYVYDRWRPLFYVSGSEKTSSQRIVTAAGTTGPELRLRELDFSLGVSVPWERIRHAQALTIEFNGERVHEEYGGWQRTASRNAIRSAWAFSSAKHFGHSISDERGVAVGVTSEQVRPALGASGSADAWTADVRAFAPVFPRHGVLALRGGAGLSRGDTVVRRTFYLGGYDPAVSLTDFGSDALTLLRSAGDRVYAGRKLVVANAEYRFPLAWIERGWGTVPFFLQSLHGALFVDAGETWDRSLERRNFKTAYGGELSADIFLGFGLPLTIAGGMAWGRDGESGSRLGPVAYLRIGRSF